MPAIISWRGIIAIAAPTRSSSIVPVVPATIKVATVLELAVIVSTAAATVAAAFAVVAIPTAAVIAVTPVKPSTKKRYKKEKTKKKSVSFLSMSVCPLHSVSKQRSAATKLTYIRYCRLSGRCDNRAAAAAAAILPALVQAIATAAEDRDNYFPAD